MNLQRLGHAYVRATRQLRHPPANLTELMPFLEQQGQPEELLRSPNDGENFEIVWGVTTSGPLPSGNDRPVIAYERLGKEGKRHVLRAGGEVLLLSESELKAARFPPDYPLPF